MQFNMQIKHFFCIYPCILGVFFIVRPLPEYPALPDERAARSVISGYFRLFPAISAHFRQIHHFPPPATFFSFSPFHRLRSEMRKKSVTLYFCNFCA